MFTRRDFLRTVGAGTVGLTLPSTARPGTAERPRYLVAISALGGASINDCFGVVRSTESANPSVLNAYPDSIVHDVGPFRFAEFAASSVGSFPVPWSTDFVQTVGGMVDDTMVMTHRSTSVNHFVGQQRSVTGNGAWLGRTLQEAVANQWGGHFALPNIVMGQGGFVEPGADASIATSLRGDRVLHPTRLPLALDPLEGVPGAPRQTTVDAARVLRDSLEAHSVFGQRYRSAPTLKRWSEQRAYASEVIEGSDLADRLALDPGVLGETEGEVSPDLALARTAFPQWEVDKLEQQAALAYLLLRNQVSCSVTLGLGTELEFDTNGYPTSVPQAFDFSHGAHRSTQLFLWNRILSVVARLRALLQGVPDHWDKSETLWDNTLVYIATDFGRSKVMPEGAAEYGSGHHLDNGAVFISPLVDGGQLKGGIDPDTLMSVGPDGTEGGAYTEEHIYAQALQALGVDTTGAPLPPV